MSKYLVDQWYKKWSVWLTSIAITLIEIAPYITDLQEHFPEGHYKYFLYAILIARVVKQRSTTEAK